MDLDETMQKAQEAWEPRWRREPGERGRYRIAFESGWRACGEAMLAMSSPDMDDVAWSHDGRRHAVEFTCTWETLRYVQGVLKRMPMEALRCTRMHGRAEGGGAYGGEEA